MKRKFAFASILLSIALILIVPNLLEAATKTTKPMKGKIVSLEDVIVAKKDLQLSKQQAQELLDRNVPLVFQYNKKIYFVQNEDGSFAFKKLANYAHNKNVGIVGKTKTVNGINVIIMSNIESMD